MQKNYFMKNVLAASMLLALSMGMSSCTGLVDAVLGTSDKPTTQPTTQPTTSSAVVTADQTTITISSLEDMANAVSAEQNEQFLNAIKAKAAAGEEYTINIKSEQPLSTNSFEGLVIPRVEGSNINIVFDKPLVTTEASPLKITADEKKSNTSTDAVNELTITMPDGASDVYLNIDMPETTVTLAGNASYKLVESITASETLIVGDGVEIESLVIKGGSLEIQEGGVIEELTVNNTKDLTIINFDSEDSKGVIKRLVIADGASVNFNVKAPNIENIEGEGNAKILYGVPDHFESIDLKNVKSLSGVSFSLINDEDSRYPMGGISNVPDKTHDCSFLADLINNLGSDVKNCNITSGIYGVNGNVYDCVIVLPADRLGMRISDEIPAITFSNCKITSYPDEPIEISATSENISTFTVTFDKCEFADGNNPMRIEANVDKNFDKYENYILRIAVNNCTYNGSEFTYDKVKMRHYRVSGKNAQCYYNFNGVDYVVGTKDAESSWERYYLKPANE